MLTIKPLLEDAKLKAVIKTQLKTARNVQLFLRTFGAGHRQLKIKRDRLLTSFEILLFVFSKGCQAALANSVLRILFYFTMVSSFD